MSFDKIEKLEKTTKIYYTVSADEFKHGVEHAFKEVLERSKKSKKTLVKGFRNEALPYNVYVKSFGVESLYEEALDHILNHKYQELFDIEEIDLISSPKVTDLNFSDLKEGQPFTFAFEIENKPEVKLGEYKGLAVKKEDYEVSQLDLDQALKNKVSSDITLEPKEEPAVLGLGDTANFDFEGFVDGVAFEGGKADNFELEIGSRKFITGFEDQMVGMKSGEEKDINVKFPANYQAKNLADKDAVFKVKLHEIKVAKLPELTDEYVESLKVEGVHNKEELLNNIKETTLESKKANEDARVYNTLVNLATNNASVEVPASMVETIKNRLRDSAVQQAEQYKIDFEMFLTLNGTNKEMFELQITEEAKKRAKTSLVLEAISKAEKIEASADEIDAHYSNLASEYQATLEQVKMYIPAKEVKAEIVNKKTIDLILTTAKRV